MLYSALIILIVGLITPALALVGVAAAAGEDGLDPLLYRDPAARNPSHHGAQHPQALTGEVALGERGTSQQR